MNTASFYVKEENNSNSNSKVPSEAGSNSNNESALKDLLMEDTSGSLFDSISWLLMNSGSIDFADTEASNLFTLKASIDPLDDFSPFDIKNRYYLS
jgi:hypothetical protein